MSGPDLILEDGCVDVKSYDVRWRGDSLHNRVIAVNARKHAELRMSEGLRYLVVAVARRGMTATIARPFDGRTVDGWNASNLVSHAGGDDLSRDLRVLYRSGDFGTGLAIASLRRTGDRDEDPCPTTCGWMISSGSI